MREKTETIGFRITPNEKKELLKKARKDGLDDLSTVVRLLIRRYLSENIFKS